MKNMVHSTAAHVKRMSSSARRTGRHMDGQMDKRTGRRRFAQDTYMTIQYESQTTQKTAVQKINSTIYFFNYCKVKLAPIT